MKKSIEGISTLMPLHHYAWFVAGLFLLLVSCKKDASEIASSLEDGKSTVIYDLAGDTEASMGDGVDGKEKRPFHTFLFRFSDKRQIWLRNAADSAQWLKTQDWDIAFAKEYNSLVLVNNGSVAGTPGYGGPGTAQMIIVEKPYEKVTEAPSDEEFANNGVSGVGWDNGSGVGWYTYSLKTHLSVPIRGRTFVLKTTHGKYAKLQLVNIYKGNPPAVTDLHWPAPYFTFRYFVQEDGSRNLSTQ
ncbi:MAG: HmuY family protein [Niabella sp.]